MAAGEVVVQEVQSNHMLFAAFYARAFRIFATDFLFAFWIPFTQTPSLTADPLKFWTTLQGCVETGGAVLGVDIHTADSECFEHFCGAKGLTVIHREQFLSSRGWTQIGEQPHRPGGLAGKLSTCFFNI